MAVANGSFEIPGASAGEAESWTIVTGPAVPVYAPTEDFGWFSFWSALGDVVVVLAEFVGGTSEGFFVDWDLAGYALSYGEATWLSSTFGAGLTPSTREGFVVGWEVDPYSVDWSTVSALGVVPDFTAPAGWATDWAGITSSSFGAAEDFGSW